jgi:copper chaperone CopZ
MEFAVTGEQKIRCSSCEQGIVNALLCLPSIQDVKALVRGQRIVVRYEPGRIALARALARLEQLGYWVEPQDSVR